MAKRHSTEYRIPFTGLKVGRHTYSFEVGDSFFEGFDYSEIDRAKLTVGVDLDKRSSMLVVDFHLHGVVFIPCDRCGDDLEQAIGGDYKLVVKFGNESGNSDDDVLILGTSENELDIAQYLYEFAHLSLPARRVHATLTECNQEMLASISRFSAAGNDQTSEEPRDLNEEEE